MSREPFNAERAAMYLLGALVLCGVLVVLMTATHCMLLAPDDPACHERQWGVQVREWLSETIPVLIAIIMRGGRPPQPPLAPPGDRP
jgi:hypothetical protein